MLGRLSFRARLLLSFWVVLFVALLLPLIYYRSTLGREIVSETRSGALQRLNLVHWLLLQQRGFPDAEHLQQWVENLGPQLGARITYVNEAGTVIADSEVPLSQVPTLPSHASRPEIIQALQEETGFHIRHSSTVEKDLMYAARRIGALGRIAAGVVRVAMPVSAVKARLDSLSRNFVLIMALTFVATILVSYLLVRQLEAPLRKMIGTAEAIGAGDYSQRIRFYPGKEFMPLAESINEMAKRIHSHIQTITEQKEQLEAILNGMREGVMVLDGRGKIRTVNHALSAILPGVREFIGRRPLEVIRSAELQQACDQLLSGTAAESGTRSLEITPAPGRVFGVNLVRFHHQPGEVGAIVVFHDISTLKRLEKVRQDFVANVSHELRTPLTSIRGYAETLLGQTQSELGPSVSFLQTILRNAMHMSKMVDDLLQLARLDSRGKPEALPTTDAAEALSAAWKVCDPQASAKDVRLENLLPKAGVRVKASFDELVQVFRNILENAIRYSPAGSLVTVSSKENEDTVTFVVTDDGPGIPLHAQERIFERFYRVEKDRSDASGSTGLGLAICRHIIVNHGGAIWVESPPAGRSKGSAFMFTLTLAEESPAA
ncbi:MAG TPA: ATP-binding protein [Syntrophobacteria bacterium]|nr:ATP-binding protein [Syntrophobacteria bacterium]